MDMGNINKDMQAILDEAEECGWTCNIYHCNGYYVDLGICSPSGEDFSMSIGFDIANQAESFMANLKNYSDNYDADEHASMYIPQRGQYGVPCTIRELLDDAEAIGDMVDELYNSMLDAWKY